MKETKTVSLVEFLLDNPSKTDAVEIDITRDKTVHVDKINFNAKDFV